MLRGARALGEVELSAQAKELAESVCGRGAQDGRVVDVGLCHGSAGLMQMFARAAQLSGSSACAQASARWREWTLAQRSEESGDAGASVAGFCALSYRRGEPVMVAERGLLNGAAGVALALLDSLRGASGWDRALLLSG